MKRLALLTVLVSLMASPVWAARVESFHKTWADVKKAAQAEDKLIYLHFTTTWCGWCRKIEKDTYDSKAGLAALTDFAPASLDCTVPRGQPPSPAAKINIDLMKEFGGGGYPFLVITTPEKAVLNTIGGYVGPDRFVKELDQAKTVHRELQAFETWAAKADKAGYEYNLKAMHAYEKVRLLAKASAAATKVRALDPANKKGDAAEANWTLLGVAARAKPTSPAETAAREAKISSLVAEIRKFDPTNEKGFLAKALSAGFDETFAKARRTSDAAARLKLLAEAEGKLTELAKAAPDFERLQYSWAVLGSLYAQAGKPAKSRAALETAIKVDPDSRIAAKVKEVLARIKKPE